MVMRKSRNMLLKMNKLNNNKPTEKQLVIDVIYFTYLYFT